MENVEFAHERLKQMLSYNPDTGIITWIVRRGRIASGSVAGTRHCGGYIQIGFMGKCYLAHRLAWFLMNGEWPEFDIDHMNGVKDDNRSINLRSATKTTNMQNFRKARKDSQSGLIGTSPSKGRWQSKIQIGGVTKYIGTYDTAEQAHQAYLEAKRILHGGCTI